jgi:hypothetical protein
MSDDAHTPSPESREAAPRPCLPAAGSLDQPRGHLDGPPSVSLARVRGGRWRSGVIVTAILALVVSTPLVATILSRSGDDPVYRDPPLSPSAMVQARHVELAHARFPGPLPPAAASWPLVTLSGGELLVGWKHLATLSEGATPAERSLISERRGEQPSLFLEVLRNELSPPPSASSSTPTPVPPPPARGSPQLITSELLEEPRGPGEPEAPEWVVVDGAAPGLAVAQIIFTLCHLHREPVFMVGGGAQGGWVRAPCPQLTRSRALDRWEEELLGVGHAVHVSEPMKNTIENVSREAEAFFSGAPGPPPPLSPAESWVPRRIGSMMGMPFDFITLRLQRDGVVVLLGETRLRPGCDGRGEGVTVPRRDGEHDREAIVACLARLRRHLPTATSFPVQAIVLMDDFQSLVTAFDALRPLPDGTPLLPDLKMGYFHVPSHLENNAHP